MLPVVEASLISTQVCVPYTPTTMGTAFSVFRAINSVRRNPELTPKFSHSRRRFAPQVTAEEIAEAVKAHL